MSLSLIMIARINVGLRSFALAAEVTASEMRRHWDGDHAGVCQRIFSFTAQMVLVRQESPVSPATLSAGVTAASVSVSSASLPASLAASVSSPAAGVDEVAASSACSGRLCDHARGAPSRALAAASAAQENFVG